VAINGKEREKTFPAGDQFAPELVHFSECVRSGKRPEPDGREGLADVRIVEAIFKSAASGRAVRIAPVKAQKQIRRSQKMKRPRVQDPVQVNVEPPHSGA
jgi:glucose-fructose oxidoreductase